MSVTDAWTRTWPVTGTGHGLDEQVQAGLQLLDRVPGENNAGAILAVHLVAEQARDDLEVGELAVEAICGSGFRSLVHKSRCWERRGFPEVPVRT